MNSASAWTTLMALSLGTGCTSPDAGAEPDTVGSGGAGGGGTTTTSAVATSASSTTGSGGPVSHFNCDPAAEPGSIYELAAVSYDIEKTDPVSMCEYRGEVMLVVNTAAL
jgi:hypothetical protein